MIKIGVLDIQGSVEEHFESLKKLSKKACFKPILVKNCEDLQEVKGLIIPGGESTAIGKLLRRSGLREEIIERAKMGMAVWGSCAGAILIAKKIIGRQQADTLKLMDIAVTRNAYGRQLDSFETQIEFDFSQKSGHKAQNSKKKISAIFIRAPKIVKVGKGVKILAKYKDEVAAAREKNFLVTNFHPELTENLMAHAYFVKMCV